MYYFFQEHGYAADVPASGLTETGMSGVQFGDSGMPPGVKVVKLSVTTRGMAKVSWNLTMVFNTLFFWAPFKIEDQYIKKIKDQIVYLIEVRTPLKYEQCLPWKF